ATRSRENVQAEFAGITPPVRLRVVPPAVAPMEPPPHPPASPFGVAICRRPNEPLNATPVRSTARFGFVIVTVVWTVEPTGAGEGENPMLAAGGEAMFTTAVATFPWPPSLEVT